MFCRNKVGILLMQEGGVLLFPQTSNIKVMEGPVPQANAISLPTAKFVMFSVLKVLGYM